MQISLTSSVEPKTLGPLVLLAKVIHGVTGAPLIILYHSQELHLGVSFSNIRVGG